MILERKKINCINEYVDFVRSWYGNNWSIDDLDKLKERFNIPTSFPAIVWIEQQHWDGGGFGDNRIKKLNYIDKENLEIPRKKE